MLVQQKNMNNDFAKRKCIPCEGGAKPLEQKFIDEYMESVPLWRQSADARSIERVFVFPDFVTGLAFVNTVGAIAEAEGHHPDILLTYTAVTITLSTHAIGGLSENDFIVASKIDEIK
jgi:4a-hydroxytetrahydrobiopterin dehydratase